MHDSRQRIPLMDHTDHAVVCWPQTLNRGLCCKTFAVQRSFKGEAHMQDALSTNDKLGLLSAAICHRQNVFEGIVMMG